MPISKLTLSTGIHFQHHHTQITAQVCKIQVCKHNSTGATDAAEPLGVGVSDKGLVGVCEVAQRRPTECQVQSEGGGTSATPVLAACECVGSSSDVQLL